jgi:aryl-alcohol dehydrogenase-like predicted oxidoreductase
MGKVSKTDALRAMAEAFELGVTHFDVARSYGFGRAENVLGSFIKGRREKVTITTKFGVVPPVLNLRTKAAMPVARLVAKFMPQLKAKLKKKSGQLLAERNFEVAYARKCLDQSLTALATDYIDIYLVHEPDAALMTNPEELCRFMDENVIAGKIRRWGFAYRSVQDYEWAGAIGGDVIQFEGNADTLPKCGAILGDARQKVVTRPFMGGLDGNHSLAAIVQELELGPILHELDVSLADVALYLSWHLAGPTGSVLTSMFSQVHIQKNIRAIDAWVGNKRMDFVIEKLNSRFKIQNNHKEI